MAYQEEQAESRRTVVETPNSKRGIVNLKLHEAARRSSETTRILFSSYG